MTPLNWFTDVNGYLQVKKANFQPKHQFRRKKSKNGRTKSFRNVRVCE
jgi:hypothetical protein